MRRILSILVAAATLTVFGAGVALADSVKQ